MRHFLILCLSLAVLPRPAAAGEKVDFLRDIKPLLKQRCFACHGALKQKAKLRLDSTELIRKGGRHGPAVKPGDAVGSLLIERLTDPEPSTRMPPQGKPLTDRQIRLLKTWIEEGAPIPPGEKAEDDPRKHWAFQKPVRPPIPRLSQTGHRDGKPNPIDAFLDAERLRKGVTPGAPADRATLLRRVYLDLIGLPPTRRQLQDFLADTSPDAYENVVERLLASPQYGERWGRHWMDVWRYSDWYGRRSVPDVMNSYPQIWRWRDWIVRSLNADRGYDRLIVEMLAADEVSPQDEDNLAATGFLVRNWFKWNYNQWMRDNVEHTGKAFLGLTFNCCHCHDHKYDPLTQQEYFQFRAFFEPLELRHDRVAGEPDPGSFQKYVYGVAYGPIHSGRIRVFDEKADVPTYFYSGGDERNRVPGKPPIAPGVPVALGGEKLKIEAVSLPPTSWYPGLKDYVQREETAKREAAVAQAESALKKTSSTLPDPERRLAEARLTAARSDLESIRARIAADQVVYLGTKGDAKEASRKASRAERQSHLDAAHVAVLQAENALAQARKQNAKAPQIPAQEKQRSAAQAKVAACTSALAADSTTYSPLSPLYPHTSTGRRTALARWIASTENPLTARVAVNYIWGWHFGRPLVDTTSNFGRSGARPSHPHLLDWLAVELMQNGWRMKHLHRLLVTSAAYRQSADPRGVSANEKIDPENRLLWKFNARRMEAEEVRDSLLAVAGTLDPTMGGPEIPQEQGQTVPRRSLYFAHHGEGRMAFLELFDAADACEAYRRSTSVMPQQALALSNSDLALRQGRLLARRLWGSATSETKAAECEAQFIQAAFEQVLGRSPSPREREATTDFLARQRRLFAEEKAALTAASKEVSAEGPSLDPAARARENFIHALLNHHDFVTVR